jgi:hypothetical protein
VVAATRTGGFFQMTNDAVGQLPRRIRFSGFKLNTAPLDKLALPDEPYLRPAARAVAAAIRDAARMRRHRMMILPHQKAELLRALDRLMKEVDANIEIVDIKAAFEAGLEIAPAGGSDEGESES